MSNWLNFESIKRDVSLEPILRHYGVRLRRMGKDQYRGRCPIHRGEGREAFHVNLTRNIFHCFACEAGGTVLDFVAAMERCSLYEAAQRLQTLVWSLPERPNASVPLKELVTKRKRVSLPLTFALRGIDCAHPYLAHRGISRETAVEFGVGFYGGPGLMSKRLVIPIHNSGGELVGYCGRSLDQTPPRYRVPPGFAKSEIVYNMHRAVATGGNSVVVVEGFFDCMKVHQAGIPAVVALMGSALYEPQRRAILERFRRVLLMLDGDATGLRASKQIAGKLRSEVSVEILELPIGVQPDQLSADVIRRIVCQYCLDDD